MVGNSSAAVLAAEGMGTGFVVVAPGSSFAAGGAGSWVAAVDTDTGAAAVLLGRDSETAHCRIPCRSDGYRHYFCRKGKSMPWDRVYSFSESQRRFLRRLSHGCSDCLRDIENGVYECFHIALYDCVSGTQGVSFMGLLPRYEYWRAYRHVYGTASVSVALKQGTLGQYTPVA